MASLQEELVAKQRKALQLGASIRDATLAGKLPLYPENQDLVPAQESTPMAERSILPTTNLYRNAVTPKEIIDTVGGLVNPAMLPTPTAPRGGLFENLQADYTPLKNAWDATKGFVQELLPTPYVDAGQPAQTFEDFQAEQAAEVQPQPQQISEDDTALPGLSPRQQALVDAADIAKQDAEVDEETVVANLKQRLPEGETSWLDALAKEFDLVTVGMALLASNDGTQSFSANLGDALMAGKAAKKRKAAEAAAGQQQQFENVLAERKVAADEARSFETETQKKLKYSEMVKNIAQAQKYLSEATGTKPSDLKVSGEERKQALAILTTQRPDLKANQSSENLALQLAKYFKSANVTDPNAQLQVAERVLSGQNRGEDVLEEPFLFGSQTINPESLPNMNLSQLMRMVELQSKAGK